MLQLDQLIPYYGTGEDQLHLFNFLFVHWSWTRPSCGRWSRRSRRSCRPVRGRCGRAPTTTRAGSPRAGRAATRRARAALLMLLTLRGTPFLYYGDELALPDAELDPARALDPVLHRTGDRTQPRRVPHADAVGRRAGRGFTSGATPWLPFNDGTGVAARRPGLDAHLVRDLIALRGGRAPTCARRLRDAVGGPWVWRRGEHLVALQPVRRAGRGRGARDAPHRHQPFARVVRRAPRPWEGVVLDG